MLQVVTDGPPRMCPVHHGQMYCGICCSPGLCHTHFCPSFTYRRNLLSSLKTTEFRPTLQWTFSVHLSNHAWRCHDVSGSDVILVLLQSDGFQCSMSTLQVQHVPGFLSWTLFGQPLLLVLSINLAMHLYYTAVQNLVYGCGNVSQTTKHTTVTLHPTCAVVR